MLIEEIRGIKSDRRDLRNFGFVVGGVLLALAALLLFLEGTRLNKVRAAIGGSTLVVSVGAMAIRYNESDSVAGRLWWEQRLPCAAVSTAIAPAESTAESHVPRMSSSALLLEVQSD